MNEHKFKELLRSVVDNNFQPPTSLSPREYLPNFYKFIGSTDSELREDLIFSVMANWIYKGIFTNEQIYKIADTLVQDDYILNGIGLEKDDSVFIRSNTALQLWALVVTQKKREFIPFNTIGMIFEKTLQLLEREVDYRVFVPGSGWANSISHAANILLELVQLPEMKKPWIVMILNSICNKVLEPDFKFPGDEIEHLAAPVAVVLLKEILLEEEFMPALEKLKIKAPAQGQNPNDFFRAINVRCFLRSVYFQLLDQPDLRRPRDIILLILQDLKPE